MTFEPVLTRSNPASDIKLFVLVMDRSMARSGFPRAGEMVITALERMLPTLDERDRFCELKPDKLQQIESLAAKHMHAHASKFCLLSQDDQQGQFATFVRMLKLFASFDRANAELLIKELREEYGYNTESSGPAQSGRNPGAVGWLLDSNVTKDLIRHGANVRVKVVDSEDRSSVLPPPQAGISGTTCVIFSTPGKAFRPGRRLAEVTSQIISTPGSDNTFEAMHVTVFGPNCSLFCRERLFDDPVLSREKVISILSEHFKKGA